MLYNTTLAALCHSFCRYGSLAISPRSFGCCRKIGEASCKASALSVGGDQTLPRAETLPVKTNFGAKSER